ncbi:MAG: hypothetical protein ABL977_05175 [Candidatus Eisenbacteria bacterium]
MNADPHVRYRDALALEFAGLLADSDAAWMAQHATECAACRSLRERVRARVHELRVDEGHAPAEMLSAWLHEPSAFTPLEAELVQRHLAACATCRAELAEMAAFAQQPVPVARARRHDWRGPALAGLAAAAALVAVFFARVHEPASLAPGALPTPKTVLPAQPAPAPVISARLVIPERTRAAAPETLPVVRLQPAVTQLRLRLPALFMEPGERVEVRLARADGERAPVVRTVRAASLAEDLVVELMPADAWIDGVYRIRIIPDAGRDTAATREFRFRIEHVQR